MVDTQEQQNIRGLDIDKAIKNLAKHEYIFKSDCAVSPTSGDAIRWYQETAAELTPTGKTDNVSPLSLPQTAEVSWTRNTSYTRKYFVSTFISKADIETADIDVLARSLQRLVRYIASRVDARIYSVVTGGTGIWTFATTAVGGDQWDAAAFGGNPIADLMYAKQLIFSGGLSPEGASLWLDPVGYTSLFNYLIVGKGSSVPNWSSSKMDGGTVTNLLGLNVKVSNNVTTDNAVIIIPNEACSWKERNGLTSAVIDNPGIGKEVRVWEEGEAILTNPKAVCVITDINTA